MPVYAAGCTSTFRNSRKDLDLLSEPFLIDLWSLAPLSRRRVYYEMMKYERDGGGGRVSPLGLSTFTTSAAEDVKSIEVIL